MCFDIKLGHTAVVYKDGLWVFGGWDGRETLDSLWHFDFVTDSWTPICFDPDGKDGAENLTSSTKEGLVKYRKKQLSYLYSRYGIQTACKWDRGVHTNETWPENRYRHSAVGESLTSLKIVRMISILQFTKTN